LDRIKELEGIQKPILDTYKTPDISLDKVAEQAKARIELYEKNPKTKTQMKEDIDSFIEAAKNDAISKGQGESITPTLAKDYKTGAGQEAYNLLRPSSKKASRIIADILKTEIEDRFKQSPDINIIKDLNKAESELFAVIDLYNVRGRGGIHGKTLRGGVLGKKFDELTGSILGSATGVPIVGPLLGMKIASKLNEFRLNPERLSMKAIKELQKTGALPKYINTLQQGYDFLQMLNRKNAPLQLPAAAPGATKFGGGAIPENPNAIYTPPPKTPTTYESKAHIIGGQGQTGNKFSPTNRVLLPPGTGIKGKTLITRPPTTYEKGVKPVIEGKVVDKFERAKNLSAVDRNIETKAFDKITKSEEKILSDYTKPFCPNCLF